MISAQFDYIVPKTLAEAISLLGEHPDEAKILAGGHSLIPAMKLRLATPQLLIDIGRIKDLSYIREEGGKILIGAMTTHYQIETSSRLQQICPLLSECAKSIGDVQVRNRGTIGGSLAHSDPAADWPAAVLALGAELVISGAKGERTVKADSFFVDLLTTVLGQNEILKEIRITIPSGKVGQAYLKAPQPASGFAVVGVAVNLTLDSGKINSMAVGVTGVGSKAYRASAVESALKGAAPDAQTIAAAAAHATDGIDANGDLYASSDFRRHLAEVYTKRAIAAAVARAK